MIYFGNYFNQFFRLVPLISIKGVGDKFVEKHGVLFLEVINKHVGQQPING